MEHLQLKNPAFCIGLYLLPYIYHLCFSRFSACQKQQLRVDEGAGKGKPGLKPGGVRASRLGRRTVDYKMSLLNIQGAILVWLLDGEWRGWKADPHFFLLGIMMIEISWIITLSVYRYLIYRDYNEPFFLRILNFTPNRIMECQKGLWTLLRWIIWFRSCPWWKTHCVFV